MDILPPLIWTLIRQVPGKETFRIHIAVPFMTRFAWDCLQHEFISSLSLPPEAHSFEVLVASTRELISLA